MWSSKIATILILSLTLSSANAVFTLTLPNGSYAVAQAIQEVTNNNMSEPFAPKGTKRRLMLSAFFPTAAKEACQAAEIPYMPPFTASVYDQLYASVGILNGTFESFRLTTCEVQKSVSVTRPCQHFPVILFSPGLGNSRLIYSALAESIAAQGFVVITVDHPHDAAVVEFLDGSYVLAANITTPDQIELALNVRTQDMTFIIDQLHNRTFIESFLTGVYGSVDVKTLFIAGHSLGGATAAEAMLNDQRLLSGINLDGTFFGSVLQNDLSRPFMMLAHQGKNQSTDSSWAEIWPHLRDSKVQASLEGTVHASYTDFPLLVDTLGLRSSLPEDQVAELVGTVHGERMLEIVASCTRAFFCSVPSRPQLFEQSLANITEVEVANITIREPDSCHSLVYAG